MFPLNFNSLFRKSNGELTTLGKMFDNAGGSYTLPTASTSTKGGVKVGSGLTMDGETLNNDNPTPYTLPTASASTKGGVKVGSGLTMDGETLNNDNPTPYTLPTASASTKGGVKVGSGLTMDGETLNNDNPTPYTLPTASASTKGGVKVGTGLTMDGDTLKNTNPTPLPIIKTLSAITTTTSGFYDLSSNMSELTSNSVVLSIIPDSTGSGTDNVIGFPFYQGSGHKWFAKLAVANDFSNFSGTITIKVAYIP